MRKWAALLVVLGAAATVAFFVNSTRLPEGAEYIIPDTLPEDVPLTLVLHGVRSSGSMDVVTDQEAIAAARGVAYVVSEGGVGDGLGSFTLAMMGAPMEESFSAIYQGDTLLHSISCLTTVCGRFGEREAEFAGLLEAARPLRTINARFEDYARYTDKVAEIRAAPDLFFAGFGAGDDLPEPYVAPAYTAMLPTLALPADQALLLAEVERTERARIEAALPEGMSVARVRSKLMPAARVIDQSTSEPLMHEGAAVYFPAWRFVNLTATIAGTTEFDTIPETVWKSPSHAPEALDADFEALLRDLGHDPCEDCYALRVDGDYLTRPFGLASDGKFYFLTYYEIAE